MKVGYYRTILTEPYTHFFLIGTILYIVYKLINPVEKFPQKKIITITKDQISDINHSFSSRLGHTLSPTELNIFIKDRYNDEILLNESISLQLYKRDVIVRDRLVDRMRHIVASITPKEPTELQIHLYYDNHIEDYSTIIGVSFSHIYFKDIKESDSKYLIELLNRYDIKPSKVSKFGDRYSGKYHIENIDFDELSSIFGKYFASQMWHTISHRWQGDIRSKIGTHIVYIRSKKIGDPLPFDEVEDRVYRDYMRSVTEQNREKAYKKLSTQYRMESI